jgi:methyltransferase (TIGR00027 family)
MSMQPVASTARWTAALRARESQRPDRLFHDPFARALAGVEGLMMLEHSEQAHPEQVADIAPYIVIRTRFFDDLALGCATEGVRQVVIVGAGMDTRAFRLPWPAGTSLYELDHPELLDLKEEILVREGACPQCHRSFLGVDLEGEWRPALTSAGFAPGEASLWLVEGVFYYLEEQGVHDLVGHISSLTAPGSRLGADMVSAAFFTSPWMREVLRGMEERGMPWKFGTDDPEALLAGHGWQAQVVQPGEEGADYGRWTRPAPPPREQREFPHSFLVVAHR